MSDNVRKLQDLYAAFGRGDIQTILDNVTDDITWGTESAAAPDVPWYQIRHGVVGVADFFATVAREVEFTNFNPTFWAGEGDEVIVHVDIDYRIRRNGRTAKTGSVHRYTVRDGKVSKMRAFEDTAGVRDAYNG